MRSFRFLGLLLAALPALMAQQESGGTILGRITDPSGAGVAQARITATNVLTNVTVPTTSNDDGNYQVPFLPAGDYNIAVECAGFKAIRQEGIHVSMNARVTLNLSLQVGAVHEAITIKGDATLLNLTNADLGQVVENAYVNQIQVGSNRNTLLLAFLAPGVGGSENSSQTGNTLHNVSFDGGGGRIGGNEYLVDGFPSTTFNANQSFVPSMDGMDELKVTTGLFDASLGRTNGGVVSVTTKGGTNQLHGTGYFYRDPVGLASKGWTRDKYGTPLYPSGYHQYGLQVGGPVVLPRVYNGRNRTFFSVAWEQDYNPRFGTKAYRAPTALERQGDFSQTLASSGQPLVIYDPSTTVVNGGVATRQPFPGARIPTSRINPTGAAVLNLFSLPNQNVRPQIGLVNFGDSTESAVHQKEYSGRLDENISDRQRLFTRASLMGRISDVGVTQYDPAAIGPNPAVTHYWDWGVGDTLTFSPTLVGTVRLGVVGTTYAGNGGAYGLNPAVINTPAPIASQMAFEGFSTFKLGEDLGTISSTHAISTELVPTVQANFTKMIGNHNLRWGGDYRLDRFNNLDPGANGLGNFTFDSVFTQSNPFVNTTTTTSGTSMASLLLGLPASGAMGNNVMYAIQASTVGLWVQDDWKATRKLTLNFGLRYDLETPYTERYNRQGYGFNYTTPWPVQVPGVDLRGGLLFAGVDGNPRTAGNTDWNNFGPRFGFAYQVLSKTVIRGGYGWFYGMQGYNGYRYLDPGGIFSSTTPMVATIDNGATPYTTLANPFPNGLVQPVGSSAGLMALAGNALNIWAPDRLNPYNLQWQFDVQQELPSRILAEVAYVGMHSLKEGENFNLNELPDQYLPLGTAQNKSVPNPFRGVFPTNSTLGQGATVTQKQLWLGYPQYTALTVYDEPTGNSIYHALQARMEKRFTHGLTLLTNYTFSKLIVSNTTSLVNPRHYRTVSSLDQSHVFRQAFTYMIPFRFAGSGSAHWLLRELAGGWEIAGWWEYMSGFPLSVTQANGRPYRIAPVAKSGPIESRLGDRRDPVTGAILNPYFNTNAFQALPTQYMVTPEPPVLSQLRGPATADLNASADKSFAIAERFKLMVRIEFTQLTNTPLFDNPGLNMSNPGTFGVILTDHGQRVGQICLRLLF